MPNSNNSGYVSNKPEWFTPEELKSKDFTIVGEAEPAIEYEYYLDENGNRQRKAIGQKTHENIKVWQAWREKWEGWTEPKLVEERIYIVSEKEPELNVSKKRKFLTNNTVTAEKLRNSGGGHHA